MNQASISKISDSSGLDEAPGLTQADFDRAKFRIAGKEVSRDEWQAAALVLIGQARFDQADLRDFSQDEIQSWIADDEEGMRRFIENQ